MTAKLLAFDGSGRKDSINRKLLDHVVGEVKAAGGTGTVIDLTQFNLPIYNGDIESQGLPAAVTQLKELFKEHDGFLIASPEHNGSFTSLLKNAIDWVSRPVKDELPLNCFKGKTVGLLSATPGKIGGLRGIYQLNTVLFILGSLVLPEIVSVGFSGEAFDADGKLTNERDKNAATNLAKRIVKVAEALK
jgi:NAD(P)H-dependent FMN reductase